MAEISSNGDGDLSSHSENDDTPPKEEKTEACQGDTQSVVIKAKDEEMKTIYNGKDVSEKELQPEERTMREDIKDLSSSEESETEPGQNLENDSVPQLSEKEMEEKRKRDIELANYWKAVDENPMDFTGWTYLLQFVEQGVEVEASRKAFDAFFSHYPYCYGYWKKYSDVEKRHGNLPRAVEVFEKGLRAIPLSVELWLHYLNFYVAEFSSDENFIDNMRSLYKRAIAAAGLEFRSDKLWDSYINWEISNSEFRIVTSIYEKLISTPTQLYSHHWDNFCLHIRKHSPKDFLDSDTFLKMRSWVMKKENHEYDEDDDVTPEDASFSKEDLPPGMAASPTEDGREMEEIRTIYLDAKEKAHKANEMEVSKRWTLEETIRRPYFHVKPLERGQLKNWKEYLDFEISIGNHKRIVVLFERCMIACALYEDFWMKYAKYLEKHSIDGVRSVYQRACDIHLPKKPYIHLAWAAFEERKDNYPLARKILMNIENNVPGLAMVCMRRISLERRKGNHEAAEELFRAYIQKAVSHKARTFFSIKYARYLQKVMGNSDKARDVLTAALDYENINERVFLQLLDLEYQVQPVEEDRVHEIFDRLFKSDVSIEFKIKVSQRRMEFLEDFGMCIQKISDAYDEHQKLLKEVTTKKKKPEKEQLAEEPPDKKMRITEPMPSGPPPTHAAVTNNFHATAPAPMPQMPGPPPPSTNQTDNMYAYAQQWANSAYPTTVPATGMYPGYQYNPYQQQQQPYGYYGYQ